MAFSTNGASGGYGLSSEINVTPLIDVLLVMLIIFMVIVPVMPRGLNSALQFLLGVQLMKLQIFPSWFRWKRRRRNRVRQLCDTLSMEWVLRELR
jgi:predicted ABC-type exoprotein transport system permease subunit